PLKIEENRLTPSLRAVSAIFPRADCKPPPKSHQMPALYPDHPVVPEFPLWSVDSPVPSLPLKAVVVLLAVLTAASSTAASSTAAAPSAAASPPYPGSAQRRSAVQRLNLRQRPPAHRPYRDSPPLSARCSAVGCARNLQC